ncbi:hypothetical protein EsH8_VI_000391 [Colletotrichum jinshuiense]
MAALANSKAKAAKRPRIVELNVKDSVHIHCGKKTFIVYRDIVAAGSMYFECAFFGFFEEAYTQEIQFEGDVSPGALEFYLNLAHSWFFEIKFHGIKVVPTQAFDGVIRAVQKEPRKRAHLNIPHVKLKKMVETIILADRFLHRSLLCILRQMFLSLLDFTHRCWVDLKAEAREWDMLFHVEIMVDYIDAFHLLSTGHDDEGFLRAALTESFYWFSLNTPSLRQHFKPLMKPEFVAEWSRDRTGHEESEMFSRARGIFATDQLIFASQTRIQKNRRFKRIMNLCPPQDRQKWLPWVDDCKEKQIRVKHLHAVVKSTSREKPPHARNPNTTAFPQQPTASTPSNQPFDGANNHFHPAVNARGTRGRGRGRGTRGGLISTRGHHHVAATHAPAHPGHLPTLFTGGHFHAAAQISNQLAHWPGVINAVQPQTQGPQISSVANNIQAWVSAGGHNAVQYLQTQAQQGQLQTNQLQQGQTQVSQPVANQPQQNQQHQPNQVQHQEVQGQEQQHDQQLDLQPQQNQPQQNEAPNIPNVLNQNQNQQNLSQQTAQANENGNDSTVTTHGTASSASQSYNGATRGQSSRGRGRGNGRGRGGRGGRGRGRGRGRGSGLAHGGA